jgi:type IV pilus assembly protein PilX
VKRQRGAILLITLVVLVVLLMTGLALYRSTQVVTDVAGNMAFKQAALPIANIAIEQAVATINGISNFNTSIANQYYPIQLSNDADGLPKTISWGTIPSTHVNAGQQSGFAFQSIIDRLCIGPLPVTNPGIQCAVGQTITNSSYKVNSPFYASGMIYYRVTVRVTGPKNTLTFVQAIIER